MSLDRLEVIVVFFFYPFYLAFAVKFFWKMAKYLTINQRRYNFSISFYRRKFTGWVWISLVRFCIKIQVKKNMSLLREVNLFHFLSYCLMIITLLHWFTTTELLMRKKFFFSARCRRLYDVANVLIALKLIKRGHFIYGTRKTAGFLYCGPEPSNMLKVL